VNRNDLDAQIKNKEKKGKGPNKKFDETAMLIEYPRI
jgi:hypothetical protein